jgi:hypothetical protein
MVRVGESRRASERDVERGREMERDGERWREMERDGERWREMESQAGHMLLTIMKVRSPV